MANKRSRKQKSKTTAPIASRKSFDTRLIAPALLIVAATVIAYLPAFGAGFIWDDPDYVINNYTLRDLAGLRDIWFHPTSLPQWYPLVHTTFWIEYQFFGAQSATIYHVTNILLHTISALLL